MLVISPSAWQQIYDAVTFRPDLEVGGFGRVTVRPATKAGDTELFVDDILIPPQVVNQVHTDITVDSLDWLQMNRLKAGDIGQWWLWWHSHNMMPVNPSFTDTSTLERAARGAWGGKALGLVVNVFENTHGWLGYMNPILGTYDSVKINVQIEREFDPALRFATRQAMVENVKVEVPKPVEKAKPKTSEGKDLFDRFFAKPRQSGAAHLDEHDDWPTFEEWESVEKRAEQYGIGDLTDAEWQTLIAGEEKFGVEAVTL